MVGFGGGLAGGFSLVHRFRGDWGWLGGELWWVWRWLKGVVELVGLETVDLEVDYGFSWWGKSM